MARNNHSCALFTFWCVCDVVTYPMVSLTEKWVNAIKGYVLMSVQLLLDTVINWCIVYVSKRECTEGDTLGI